MPSEKELAKVRERFPGDIAHHVTTVAQDSGLFRHLKCRHPDTYAMGFDVTTWPGHLAITGDMGSYVFSRVPDMFTFFRRRDDGKVNLSYWAEKLVATSHREGHEKYDPDVFRETVTRRFAEWLEDHPLGGELPALHEQLTDDVLATADDGEDAARRAVDNFGYSGHQVFTDFYEHSLRAYTYHFVWCCHAIVWAIAQYDAQIAAANTPEAYEARRLERAMDEQQ